MSSFDTPRIDNITQGRQVMNIIPTTGSSSALSSGSMTSWITNASGDDNGTPCDDYMFRHSDFTIPTSNHLKAAQPPPPPSLSTKNHSVKTTSTTNARNNSNKPNSPPGKRSIMGTT
ncbi:MAG: hypothetical protein SGILL_009904, partial [Bacillariaceae sp.]